MAKSDQRAGWRKTKARVEPKANSGFGQRGRERRKLLFKVSMLFTFAIALAIMLVLVFLRRPEPDVPLIISVVSQAYSKDAGALVTGPNPYAEEDVQRLYAWFGHPETRDENVSFAGRLDECQGTMRKPGQLINAITGQLARVDPGGPGRDMIAVYLSAHGFSDGGKPYLAVGDSRPDRPTSWVSFETLYEQLVQTLKQRGDAASNQRVVLFIDAARVGPLWDWGQFQESFADACRSVAQGGSERVAVVLSASPGERSWWDPRAGHSLFVDALIESLTGLGDLNQDKTVTVGEITAYLRHRVGHAANTIWGTSQTPFLVNDEALDWELISRPSRLPAPPLDQVDRNQLRKSFADVDALWKRHNELARRVHNPLAFNPLAWSLLEKKLARVDALLLAGSGYQGRFKDLMTQCDQELSRLESGPMITPGLQDTLPELALRDYFFGPPDPSGELVEAVEGWYDKPVIDAFQVPVDQAQATRFLWAWLQNQAFDADALQLAADFLESKKLVNREHPPGLLETFLVRLFSSPDMAHVGTGEIRAIVQSHQLCREILFAGDLRALFWVREPLLELNQQRMASIDRMLSRDASQRSAGLKVWQRTLKGRFESLRDDVVMISEAYRLRDRMLHGIPRVAETLMSDSGAFAAQRPLLVNQNQRAVADAMARLAELTRVLQLPSENDVRSAEVLREAISDASRRAGEANQSLLRRLNEQLDNATDQKAPDANGLRQNLALLAGSGTSVFDDRQRVHVRLCEILDNQSDLAIPEVPEDMDVKTVTEAAKLDPDAAALNSVSGRFVWDHWLHMTEDPTWAPGRSAERLSADAHGGTNVIPESGTSFRQAVAQLTAGQLDQELSASQVISDPVEKAEQQRPLVAIRHLIDQWDTHVRSRTLLFSSTAESVEEIGEARFVLDALLCLFDHGRRSMDEFWCQARPGDRSYADHAAGALLAANALNRFYSRLPARLDGEDLQQRLETIARVIGDRNTLSLIPADQFRGGLPPSLIDEQVTFSLRRPAEVPVGVATVWSQLGNDTHSVAFSKTDAETLPVAFAVPAAIPEDASSIGAGLFFRGLRRGGEIQINRLRGGLHTAFELPKYDAPSVIVTREDPEPERLLLVIDCSYSMVLFPRGNVEKRLEAAVRAVKGFLNNLQGDVEVGLIVFGDRFGFEQEENGDLVARTGADGQYTALHVLRRDGRDFKDAGWLKGNEPPTETSTNPNNDVRVAVSLAKLTAAHRTALNRELDQLWGVGTTPTYRAIVEAYEQLGDRGGHIIVLTDGNPTVPHLGSGFDDRQKAAMELAKRRRQPIQLTIVHYQVEEPKLVTEYKSVAKMLEAADAQTLQEHLDAQRPKPLIVWERNHQEVSARGDFRKTLRIQKWPPVGTSAITGHLVTPAEEHSVRVSIAEPRRELDENADVKVSGGEAFELVLSGDSLNHRPFPFEGKGYRVLSRSRDNASDYQVLARIKRTRNNQRLTTEIAIEHVRGDQPSGRFTPRPSDVWVELVGMGNATGTASAGDTYTFGIPEFESARSIPVLLTHIDNLPKVHTRLAVNAWLRFGDEPLEGTTLSFDGNGTFVTEDLPGVSFKRELSTNASGGLKLTLTERYDGKQQPGTIRVLSAPSPDDASVEVYPEQRIVIRHFNYDIRETTPQLTACDAAEIKRRSTLQVQGTIPITF